MKKVSLFGIMYNPTDYQESTKVIIDNARNNSSFTVSALAVHGLIEGYNNLELRNLINSIDLVLPDGQPVRWALNFFHKCGLKDRVYGPSLTLSVLTEANNHKLKVYLYGSTKSTLDKFDNFIKLNYPNISVCGIHEDRFRDATEEEDKVDIEKINNSGANIVLVGRGCPRQERWVAEHKNKIDAAMLAVGAAFDFHAGTSKQAPPFMQKYGLEWLFRLIQEPGRLWKRYLFTNSKFIYLVVKQKLNIGRI